VRKRGAISGSTLRAAVEMGEENAFFARGRWRGLEDTMDWSVRIGEEARVDCIAGGFVIVGLLSSDGGAFNGLLKGDRKGFASVRDATLILRRLAAGVDMLGTC